MSEAKRRTAITGPRAEATGVGDLSNIGMRKSKPKKTARDAINKQEEIKREIIQLETLHKAALINSSIARGEQAQFQEFLNDRAT